MSEVLFVFSAGLGGVFLSMALLYASMRFTAMIAEILPGKEEKGEKK